MAGKDIQLENGGYTQIHNEILEVLAKTDLPAGELRIVIYLLRKTYGWQSKTSAISLSEWEQATGIKSHNVLRQLRSLESKNVIRRVGTDKDRKTIWAFNKYHENWFQDLDTIAHDTITHDSIQRDDTITHDTDDTITGDSTYKERERNKDLSLSTPHDPPVDSRVRTEADPTPTPTPTETLGKITNPVDPRALQNGLVKPGTGRDGYEVYREVFEHIPTQHQIRALRDEVTDLPKWRQVLDAWALCGYRSNNMRGLLDWYRDGIPEHTGGTNGKLSAGVRAAKGTGSGKRSQANSGKSTEERQRQEQFTPEEAARYRAILAGEKTH